MSPLKPSPPKPEALPPRFYPILDLATAGRLNLDPLEAARVALGEGARMLQLRRKGPFTREAFALADSISRVAEAAGAALIVNDRADIARMVDAAGVHLGQDDPPPAVARRLLGERPIIGFSTHNEAQLRAADAEPADYLALGPVFGTGSKANPDPTVGVAELRRLRPLTRRPLVAIGGLNRRNALDVWDAGADSVAVISDWLDDEPRRAVAEWVRLAESWSPR